MFGLILAAVLSVSPAEREHRRQELIQEITKNGWVEKNNLKLERIYYGTKGTQFFEDAALVLFRNPRDPKPKQVPVYWALAWYYRAGQWTLLGETFIAQGVKED